LQGTVPAGTVPCKITVFPAKLGYIGGEESGVLNEIEGKRIEPRQKPPFVSTVGLFGKPTLINNVESFANIPFIISEGAKEFKKFGTEKSPGEKMITVSGDVEKPGVYKINFGQTLNDILEIAKGPSLGKIKFALTGGFASTAITPEKFNIPFDFDSFSFGVCVGAGTVIFYNDKTDLLKEMKKWLEFFKNESCGQCTPCREGTQRLYEIIQNTLRLRSGQAKNPSTTLRAGKISKTDLARMEEMFFALETSSFCPLGASAPMAAKGLISSFRKELISEK